MRALVFILSLAILCSCSSKKNADIEPGQEIIPRDKMIAIITDLQLTESAIYMKQNQGGNAFYYSNYYYGMILKKHGINKARFNASLTFYKDHIGVLDSIYANVIANLSKLQSEKGALKKKPVETE